MTLSNDVPLPVGSGLSSLAMTVTAKRTNPSRFLKIASLWAWPSSATCNRGETRDSRLQDARSTEGFHCFFVPIRGEWYRYWFLLSTKAVISLSVQTIELLWLPGAGGRQRVVCLQSAAMVCGCTGANVSKNGSDLLAFITSVGQKLSGLGDTEYNALTSFSHQRANFSLFSSRNTTWRINMISKADRQQGYLWAHRGPAFPLSSLPLGEKVTYTPTCDVRAAVDERCLFPRSRKNNLFKKKILFIIN